MFARKTLCEADLTCVAYLADMPDVAEERHDRLVRTTRLTDTASMGLR
jgi:CTP:molybdopterin cytidylyltransferase MocA